MRRFVVFDQLEQVAFSPNIVASAIEIFAWRFAFLVTKFFFLLLDPAKFRDGENTDGIEAHAGRRRNPHAAHRRIHAEMDVLDVLQNHVNCNVAQLELRDHQYSLCALRIGKMRSTSATSFRTPNNACLMTRSRGSTPRHASGRTCFTVSSILSASSSRRFRLS